MNDNRHGGSPERERTFGPFELALVARLRQVGDDVVPEGGFRYQLRVQVVTGASAPGAPSPAPPPAPSPASPPASPARWHRLPLPRLRGPLRFRTGRDTG